MDLNHIVTIVIPAYNKYPLLERCLDSLIEHVDPRHQILILNDASPDENFETNILSKISPHKNISYFKNNINQGFVKTCNRAVFELDTTSNDILLLNSDTCVTEKAIEEMLDVLYLHDRHAVVNPRSNNATLVTIPYDNLLDNPNQSYKLWKQHKDKFPRCNVIPTVIGFCMLIRRDIISNFGLFDEIYGHGYNEENDFVCRVNRLGYSAVKANHAFVFHIEGASFGKQKLQLEETNRKILDARYPEYSCKCDEYYKYLILAMDNFLTVYSFPKPKFLYFLPDLSPIYNGTTKVATLFWKIIQEKLNGEFDIYIYIPEATYLFFKDVFKNTKNVIYSGEPIPHKFALAFKPFQLFSFDELFLLNKVALKYVYNLLDIISLRCDYLKGIYRYYATEMAYRWADGIMCISNYTKVDNDAYFNVKSTMKRVYPFSLDEIFENRTSPESEPYLLIIGNKFKHKALQQTVDSIKVDIPIVVLGEMIETKNKQVRKYPSGLLSEKEIDNLYKYAFIVIFPSQYEGFGIPVIEAAKYGKPIIVHENGCNREIVENYKVPNIYFYREFETLNSIIHAIANATIVPGNMNIGVTWEMISDQLIQILQEVHNRPLDVNQLQARWTTINTFEMLSRHYSNNSRPFSFKDMLKSKIRKNKLLFNYAKIINQTMKKLRKA